MIIHHYFKEEDNKSEESTPTLMIEGEVDEEIFLFQDSRSN